MTIKHENQKSSKDLAVKYGAPIGLLIASVPAYAIDVPDFSSIITFVGGLAAAVGSIGMAVLSIYALAKAFKIVRGAF